MKDNSLHTLVVATTNRGKLAELTGPLQTLSLAVKSLDDFSAIPEAIEDGTSFIENARIKARYYSRHLRKWVLADDSGLAIDALDGAPGVYSSRFSGQEKVTDDQRDQGNIEKVLELLVDVPPEKRQARFCCALCLCDPEAKVMIEVEGFFEGAILDQKQGDNGFGYDPIFYLPELHKTVAEISGQEKNIRSHRGQALRRFVTELNEAGFLSTD
jgi:XTP/dITP diphosphohydrolase